MRPHTTYKIYPKAINEFINDNYELNNINFGNIKNNVIAVLQKLEIDDILNAEWDISPLYFFDKRNITKNNNKPSDFDEYSNFKFIFNLKDGKSNSDYEKAIQKLESNFIFKYQNRLDLEHQKNKEQLLIKKKRIENRVYILTGLSFLALITIIYFYKNL
jgi:hypothetical protein